MLKKQYHVMVSLRSTQKLDEAGVEYSLFRLDKQAFTVDDVVKYSKGRVKIDEICKTMILTDDRRYSCGLLLLGASQIDFEKLKEVTGRNLHLASRKKVIELTGIEPGAICPIILEIPLLADGQVFDKNRINFGSGNHLYGIELDPVDLIKVVNYTRI